jgi:hypothetical protein
MSKTTLFKGDLVKRTKSAQLIKLLEENGWKRDMGGVKAAAPKGDKAPKEA